MNYRHSYHAGNFADVLKHAILALIARHLVKKDAPFRYLDTHAGLGGYDLLGEQASRTGEWREGVGRIWSADLSSRTAELLAPWRQAVEAMNAKGELRYYPGSPELMRTLARPQDRLTLGELHPEDASQLRRRYSRDKRVSVVEIDGYLGLNAFVPPKERRGLVLIDPPFEQPNEFRRMTEGVRRAHAKWPTGTYALWYPIKDPRESEKQIRELEKLSASPVISAEIFIQRPNDPSRLNGCGLAVVNPPWTLPADLHVLLPELARVLGRDEFARGRVFDLVQN